MTHNHGNCELCDWQEETIRALLLALNAIREDASCSAYISTVADEAILRGLTTPDGYLVAPWE